MTESLKARALLNFKVRHLIPSCLIQFSRDCVQASDGKVKQEHSTSWKAKYKGKKKLDSGQGREENYWMNFRDTIYIQVPGDRQSQLSLSFKFSSSLEDRRQKKPHDCVNLHFLYWQQNTFIQGSALIQIKEQTRDHENDLI